LVPALHSLQLLPATLACSPVSQRESLAPPELVEVQLVSQRFLA